MVGLAGRGLSDGGMTVYVGPASPDGFYGHMIEFGTVNAPAYPFMRPAFDMAQGAALNAVTTVLRGQLN
jgi:HK97 gp10 family phage protein